MPDAQNLFDKHYEDRVLRVFTQPYTVSPPVGFAGQGVTRSAQGFLRDVGAGDVDIGSLQPAGLEQIGALPSGVPKTRIPPGLAPPQITDEDRRMAAFRLGYLPTDQQMQANKEAIQDMGNLVPSGVEEMASGFSDLPKQPWHGAGEIARGTMKAGSPMLGAALATPLPVLSGLVIGTGTGYVSNKALVEMGVEPQKAQDISDVLSLASGILASGTEFVREYGNYRAAAGMNRVAELTMEQVPDAPPEIAAQLRAKASALTQAAQELSPSQPLPTAAPPAPLPKEEMKAPAGSTPAGRMESQLARARLESAEAAAPVVPEAPAGSAPAGTMDSEITGQPQAESMLPATPPAVPEGSAVPGSLESQVLKVGTSQLADRARTVKEGQIAAGLTPPPEPAPEPVPSLSSIRPPLSAEAGVLSLPTPQEVKSGWEWFKTRAFDEYTPLKNLAERGKLTMDEDPYIAARMYAGHYGQIWDAHRQLRDIAKPINDQKLLPQFNKLLELNRDIELFKRPDIANYVSPRATDVNDAMAQLQALRASLRPSQRAFLDSKAQEFYDFHGRNLQNFADSGMISQNALQAIRKNNEFYAPFHHLTHINQEQIPTGGKALFVRKQGAVYNIEGSASETAPVLESTLRNVHRMVSAAEKNRVGRSVADLAQRPEWQGVVRKLGPKDLPKADEGVIPVFENGVKNQYAVPKPVEEAMRGVTPPQLDRLDKVIQATNSIVRSGATLYYLPFIAKNAIRDYRTAILRSKVGFGPQDWLYGFAESIRRGPEFAQYMKSGAGQSGFFERDIKLSNEVKHITESDTRRVLRHALNPFTMLRLLSETVELTPRVGVWKRALNAGLSDREAAWLGRNVTQDFSSIGTAMRVWNSLTPFVNARLHGSANIFAAVRDNPARAATILGLTTLLPTVYAHYHNQLLYPDVLAQIPQDTQDQNYLVIYGRNQDADGNFTQVLKFPKTDYDRHFGNPIENWLNWLYKTNPKSWWQTVGDWMSDVSPVSFMRQGEFSPGRMAAEGLPPVIGAGAELLRGQDLYTGYPIEPGAIQGGTASERWGQTPSTLQLEQTPIGRMLIHASDVLKVGSPAQYRHLMRRLGAGAGRLLTAPPEEETGTSYMASASGWDTLKNMFVGARGGAEEARTSKEMEPFDVQNVDELNTMRRNRTRVLDAAKKDPDKAIDIIMDAYESTDPKKHINENTLAEAMQYVSSEAAGLTRGQSALYFKDPHVKALYLLSKQQQLPEKDYGDLEDKFLSLGYLNEATYRDMAKTQMEQDMMAAPNAAPAAVPAAVPVQPAAAPTATSPADRNNNPLNLRGPDGNFLKFATPEDGWKAAKDDLTLKMEGKSKWGIKPSDPLSKIFEVWAPVADPGNSPEGYSEYVSTRMGISPRTPIRNLTGRIDDIMRAMGEFEGWHGSGPGQAAVDQFGEAMMRAMRGGK